MYIDYLSASRLNVYIDCPLRYFLEYHICLPELKRDTIAAAKGSAVHDVLEKFALGDKNYTENLKHNYAKHKIWELDDRKPGRGFPHPMTKNCKNCNWNNGEICSIAKNNISEFSGCPAQNFEDDLTLTTNTLKKDVFSRKILGVEQEFLKEYEGFKVKGYIDIVTEIDKDTIEIGDYKTGSFTKSTEEAFMDVQLRIYSLVGKTLFPSYKYALMTLHYLRKSPITVIFDESDDEKTKKFLKESYAKISSAVNPIRKKSFKCSWCVGFENCAKFKEQYMVDGEFILPPPNIHEDKEVELE